MKYEFHWKREYSLFYGVAALYGFADLVKEYFQVDLSVRGEGKEGWFSAFSSMGMINRLHQRITEVIKSDFLALNKEIQNLHAVGQEFMAFGESLKISSDTSDDKLVSLYQEFFVLLAKYCNNLWSSFYFGEIASKIFEEILQKEIPAEKINEAITYYSQPSKKATILEIAEYFEQEKDNQKRVSYVQDNFPWLASTDPFLEPLSKKQILTYVNSFTSQKKKVGEVPELKNKEFIKIYQELLYLKDKRDEYRRKGFYYALPLFKELAKRLDLTMEELGFILPEELESFSKKDLGEQKKWLTKRKKGYLAELNDNHLKIISGSKAIKQFIEKEEIKEITEFSGTIGCPGIVTGRVQVIKSRKDLANFKGGNIFVAPTTNPEYALAMEKAIAFITDEGGLTCHAAIVAREANKPCLVGTQIATQVLKDGDLVKVDAKKGKVKKIKD